MALIQADRVKETTTTTGTGSYTLAGAETGFQSFSNGVGTSNTCYYVCTDGVDYEIGLGTLSAATTLARTTVITSSNSNNAVNWGSGTREIFTTYPGSKAVILNSSGNLDIAGALAVTGDTDVTNFSANGTLDVSGNGSVGGTFNVEGDLKNFSGNLTVDPATQIFEIKGDGSSVEGQIQLNCHVNSHGQIIKSQPHSEGVTNTMLLPKGSNSTLVSEIATQTLTNKTLTSPTINGATIDSAVSVSSAGTLNAGTNADIQGTLNVVGSAGLAGNVNLGNATADSIVVGGVLTANASANLTGNVGVGGTITGGSTVSDQDGDLRDIPVSENLSGSYTLQISDAGNQVTVNASGTTITVPTGVFAVGDIISIISVNHCTAILACTAVNAVKAGDAEATAHHTLNPNGVASIMFSYSADLAVLTGNVSGIE